MTNKKENKNDVEAINSKTVDELEKINARLLELEEVMAKSEEVLVNHHETMKIIKSNLEKVFDGLGWPQNV